MTRDNQARATQTTAVDPTATSSNGRGRVASEGDTIAERRAAERATQVFGSKGVSGATPIAEMYVHGRLMRIADGPHEVHMNQLAKFTMAQVEILRQAGRGGVDWFGD